MRTLQRLRGMSRSSSAADGEEGENTQERQAFPLSEGDDGGDSGKGTSDAARGKSRRSRLSPFLYSSPDLRSYLQRKGLVFSEDAEKFVVTFCPFCPPHKNKRDNLNKLIFFRNSGNFYCHRCGSKGSLFDFKMRTGDLSSSSGGSGAEGMFLPQQRQQQAMMLTLPAPLFDGGQCENTNVPGVHPHREQHQPQLDVYAKNLAAVATVAAAEGGNSGNRANSEDCHRRVLSSEPHCCVTFPWMPAVHCRAPGAGEASSRRGLKGVASGQTKPMPWFDEDSAGREGADLWASKLGISRCHVVRHTDEILEHLRQRLQTPGKALAEDKTEEDEEEEMRIPKDANECLLAGLDLRTLLCSARRVPHQQILTFQDLRSRVMHELVEPAATRGLQSATLPAFTAILGGFRRGELSIWTGGTGAGKTTALSQLSLDFCSQGVPTLWGSFEVNNIRLLRMMMLQFSDGVAGASRKDFSRVADSFAQLPLWLLRFHGSTSVEEVLDAMDYAVYAHDVGHVVIDNLQFMLSGQARQSDIWDLQNSAIASFRRFATQRNVHLSIVVHPRKEDDHVPLGLSSVFGSVKSTQEADNVVILQREASRTSHQSRHEQQLPQGLQQHLQRGGPNRHKQRRMHYALEIRKNRFSGELGSVPYVFDPTSLLMRAVEGARAGESAFGAEDAHEMHRGEAAAAAESAAQEGRRLDFGLRSSARDAVAFKGVHEPKSLMSLFAPRGFPLNSMASAAAPPRSTQRLWLSEERPRAGHPIAAAHSPPPPAPCADLAAAAEGLVPVEATTPSKFEASRGATTHPEPDGDNRLSNRTAAPADAAKKAPKAIELSGELPIAVDLEVAPQSQNQSADPTAAGAVFAGNLSQGLTGAPPHVTLTQKIPLSHYLEQRNSSYAKAARLDLEALRKRSDASAAERGDCPAAAPEESALPPAACTGSPEKPLNSSENAKERTPDAAASPREGALVQVALPELPCLVYDVAKLPPASLEGLLLLLQTPLITKIAMGATAVQQQGESGTSGSASFARRSAEYTLAASEELGGLSPPFFDTLLASRLLEAGQIHSGFSLAQVTERALGVFLDKQMQVSDWKLPELSDEQLLYAARDAAVLLPLHDRLSRRLQQHQLLRVADLEHRTLPAVVSMERTGMALDMTCWNGLAERLRKEQEEAANALLEQLGETAETINLNSQRQILEALRRVGVSHAPSTRQRPPAAKADAGAAAADASTTNPFVLTDTGDNTLSRLSHFPAVAALRNFRRASKAVSAFAERLPRHVNPTTGRIHAQLHQCGAGSGRFSCDSPNLQQIPREAAFRRCFVPAAHRLLLNLPAVPAAGAADEARADDAAQKFSSDEAADAAAALKPPAAPTDAAHQEKWKFLIADFSQIELRIAADIAQDEKMIEAYQKGQDLHRLTASLLLSKPEDKLSKADRQLAKAVNFGLIYGISVPRFREYALSAYGVSLTPAEARAFHANFFKHFRGITRWHQQQKRLMPLETRTRSGRRASFDDFSFTKALNYPVQGTSADITKESLALLLPRLREVEGQLVMCVHDEIIVQVPERHQERGLEILLHTMKEAGSLFLRRVPCEAEGKIGDSWADKP
ncbi:DNA polymerase [Cyclospora cayetanensis]|uniref:DNA polymerase n=1 Tax=Cyclospora cayetanensis TaxID=88456 RepID=A0A1D3D1S9_9EIME|nr:DNA polymerase [Cyclospora cayetanensis]